MGVLIAKMEAMVERGAVKPVVAGWTTMVLASEVERLRVSYKPTIRLG